MSEHGQRILCLDVSSNAAGWAVWNASPGHDVLEDFGVVRPRYSDSPPDRIASIVRGLRDIVARPLCADALVMEWCAGKVHGRLDRVNTLAPLCQAQGAVWWSLRHEFEAVHLVPENEWTRRVPKEKRAYALTVEFPQYRAFREAGKDKGFDAADAIGIGLWWIGKRREAVVMEAGNGGGWGRVGRKRTKGA